jgi:curved DNA-binding protein CbpA
MTSASKIFVGLNSVRKSAAPDSEAHGPKCQWDGCENTGRHRAPVGRGAEGLYLLFCLDHVREYNKRYDFVSGPSDAEIARFQREAAAGSRETLGSSVSQAAEPPLPSTARSGSAKAVNARKTAQQRQIQRAELKARKLKVLEAKAMETLGLPEDASPEQIRRRYRDRLKMHHPDANQGDRAAEGELMAVIQAHKILKLNGFC